jgi:hypothetical protein
MGAHTATIRVFVNDATLEEPWVAEPSRALGEWPCYARMGPQLICRPLEPEESRRFMSLGASNTPSGGGDVFEGAIKGA